MYVVENTLMRRCNLLWGISTPLFGVDIPLKMSESHIIYMSFITSRKILSSRFIGNNEVEPLREQSNATEVDNPKTWAAHSLLRVRGHRENHGLPIRCMTVHPSSLTPASTESRLNVHCMYNRCN
jgi:hypothetical protein